MNSKRKLEKKKYVAPKTEVLNIKTLSGITDDSHLNLGSIHSDPGDLGGEEMPVDANIFTLWEDEIESKDLWEE